MQQEEKNILLSLNEARKLIILFSANTLYNSGKAPFKDDNLKDVKRASNIHKKYKSIILAIDDIINQINNNPV